MDLLSHRPGMTTLEAKRRLLDWAETRDTQRAPRMNPLKAIAIAGAGVVLAGLALRRGKGGVGRVAVLAFIVRGLPWIVPMVTKALAASKLGRS